MIRTRHLAIVLCLLLGCIGPVLGQEEPQAEPAAEEQEKPKDPFYA